MPMPTHGSCLAVCLAQTYNRLDRQLQALKSKWVCCCRWHGPRTCQVQGSTTLTRLSAHSRSAKRRRCQHTRLASPPGMHQRRVSGQLAEHDMLLQETACLHQLHCSYTVPSMPGGSWCELVSHLASWCCVLQPSFPRSMKSRRLA